MSELLNRLRRWLIRKLGGFDIQKIEQTRIVSPVVNIDPIQLRVEFRVGAEQFCGFGARYFPEYIEDRMAHELVREILKRGAILLQSKENIERNEIVFRGSLFVYTPKDIGLYTREWI